MVATFVVLEYSTKIAMGRTAPTVSAHLAATPGQEAVMVDSNIPHDGREVTRVEAMAAGLKRYVSDVPCKNGHVGERSVNTNRCCTCEAATMRATEQKNAEKIRARKLARAQETREIRRAKDKAYRQANLEAVRASARERKKPRRDEINAAARAYRAENREAVNAANRSYRHTRRALLRGGGRHTPEDIQEILKQQSGKCGCCRVALKRGFHIDHIQPVSKGGSNNRRNLQLLCARCNQEKSARDPIDFMQSMGRLL